MAWPHVLHRLASPGTAPLKHHHQPETKRHALVGYFDVLLL